MEIIDGKRHEKSPQFFLERAVYFLNHEGHWGHGKDWGWLYAPGVAENLTPEAQKRGDAAFTKSFRALVNQWIDSGKDPDGTESPLDRNVREVPPGYTEPLSDILTDWLDRNPPSPVLTRSGKIAIRPHPTRYWSPYGPDKSLWAEEYANHCATYQLVVLLDTPGAHRLARCANPECGRYFLRRRMRKNEIKRGTYCGKCTVVGSTERTKISREARKQKLVDLAADFWPAWKPTGPYGRQSDWIATKMNKRATAGGPITGTWVSRNRKAIENEIERRNHAKG